MNPFNENGSFNSDASLESSYERQQQNDLSDLFNDNAVESIGRTEMENENDD